jgi:hypothetical protein
MAPSVLLVMRLASVSDANQHSKQLHKPLYAVAGSAASSLQAICYRCCCYITTSCQEVAVLQVKLVGMFTWRPQCHAQEDHASERALLCCCQAPLTPS